MQEANQPGYCVRAAMGIFSYAKILSETIGDAVRVHISVKEVRCTKKTQGTGQQQETPGSM